MLELQRSETPTPHPAIVLAGQDLTSGETTWTAEPHVGETMFSGGGARWGTDYMHARYYKPIWGRFLSVDPVGGKPELPQSWNRYAYVRGNPIRLVDPDGRIVIDSKYVVGALVQADLRSFRSSGQTWYTPGPVEYLAVGVAARGVGVANVVQTSAGAAAGAISHPDEPVRGGAAGGVGGLLQSVGPGGWILTPAKAIGSALFADLLLGQQPSKETAAKAGGPGLAVGMLELGAVKSGNPILAGFALAMDAAMQLLTAGATSESKDSVETPGPASCAGQAAPCSTPPSE